MKNTTNYKKNVILTVLICFAVGIHFNALGQEEYSKTPGTQREISIVLPFTNEPQTVTVEEYGDVLILEGDIMLPLPSTGRGSAAISGSAYRWPNATIPYVLSSSHPIAAIITEAIQYINSNTNLCVEPRTTQADYIEFTSGKGCSSFVGKQGGKQVVKLGSNCSKGNAIHELSHAAGLFHEQSRQDRDTYVTINTGNIEEGRASNFEKYTIRYSGSDLGDYDFGSIMHYGPTAFSKNGNPTIESKTPGKSFGQRNGLSAGDISGLNGIYPTACTGTPVHDEVASTSPVLDSSFDIQYEVELVPQQTGISCWAAGAAMVVGWRDRVSIDPSEIANGIGYWQQYNHPNGGLSPDDTTMFSYWGLVKEYPACYTVQGFRNLLQHGPLWVASEEPGPHIRVVSGISGDGTPDGTLVHINDPWEKGMTAFVSTNRGSTYTETYTEFMRRRESLGLTEIKIPGAISAVHP